MNLIDKDFDAHGLFFIPVSRDVLELTDESILYGGIVFTAKKELCINVISNTLRHELKVLSMTHHLLRTQIIKAFEGACWRRENWSFKNLGKMYHVSKVKNKINNQGNHEIVHVDSIILMVEVPGIEQVYRLLSEIIGQDLEDPLTYIELYTYGDNCGIDLSTHSEFSKYLVREIFPEELKKPKIVITGYKDNWQHDFIKLENKLRNALGSLVLHIDHIGSTSIPRLSAKDIIDIQLTVKSFDMFEEIRSKLESLGFIYRQDIVTDHKPGERRSPKVVDTDINWQKKYFISSANQRPTNIHIRVLGHTNQRYALLFRDYLRTNKDVALAYAEFKRRLSRCVCDKRANDGRFVYTEVKEPVMDIIILAAELWAEKIKWTPEGL